MDEPASKVLRPLFFSLKYVRKLRKKIQRQNKMRGSKLESNFFRKNDANQAKKPISNPGADRNDDEFDWNSIYRLLGRVSLRSRVPHISRYWSEEKSIGSQTVGRSDDEFDWSSTYTLHERASRQSYEQHILLKIQMK